MKIVHFADSHVGYQQYGLTQRKLDFSRAFDVAMTGALSLSPHYVTIGGDIFNKPDLRPPTLQAAERVLRRAKDAGVPLVVVTGTHDKPYRALSSWVDYLSSDGLLTVVEHNYAVFEDCIIFGAECSGHMMDDLVQVYEHTFHDPLPNLAVILLAHAGIQGTFSWRGDGLTAQFVREKMPRVDAALLGHFHKPLRSDHLFQPGSLERTALDQAEGGLWEIDFEGRAIVSAVFHPISEFDPSVPRRVAVVSLKKDEDWHAEFAEKPFFDGAMVFVKTQQPLRAEDVLAFLSPARPLRLDIQFVSGEDSITAGTLRASDATRGTLEREVVRALAGDPQVERDALHFLHQGPCDRESTPWAVEYLLGGEQNVDPVG